MLKAQHCFSKDVIDRYNMIRFNIYDDAILHCIRVLAEPYYGKIQGGDSYMAMEQVAIPAPWASSWWARLVRWFTRRVKVPSSLRFLANAKVVKANYVYRKLPADFAERIQVEIAELKRTDVEPIAIVCGYGGRERIMEALSRNMLSWYYQPSCGDYTFMGLPLRIVPWLAENEFFVV